MCCGCGDKYSKNDERKSDLADYLYSRNIDKAKLKKELKDKGNRHVAKLDTYIDLIGDLQDKVGRNPAILADKKLYALYVKLYKAYDKLEEAINTDY